MKVKAVVFEKLNEICVRDVELPELEENQILARSIYTFVSPGTELRTLEGHYGASEKFPFVPGYSVISRVEKVGSNAKHFRVGDILANRSGGIFLDVEQCFGGQSSYHVYGDDPAQHVLLGHEEDFTDEELLPFAVTEVAAISYRGVRLAEPVPGDDVLVIGQGMIGKFSAEFFRYHGGCVTVCDVDEGRLKEAARNGFSTVNLKDENAAELLAVHAKLGFDIVVECSGSSAGVKTAYSQLRALPKSKTTIYNKTLPKLVMQASYIEDVSINPSIFFKAEGVQLITPYDRDFYDRKMVAELIRKKAIDVKDYIKNVFTADEIVGAYRKLQNHEISSAVFKW